VTLPPIAVLAGGLATRLRPISLARPKAMALVNGEPFCRVQLRQLRAQGFTDVTMLIGVMGDQIRAEVGDGSRFGLRVRYLEDGPEPLGTGGAVARAMPRLGSRFFVTYGDTFLRYDPQQVVAALDRTGAVAAMVVLRNDDRWDRSNVVVEGDYVVQYSKAAADRSRMRWIDYGATLFSAEAFADSGEAGGFDLGALLERLSAEGRLAAHEVHERFYEIGTPAALAETEQFLQDRLAEKT
jgi:NDP-sugar pyrophosphorylase family protein